MHPLVAEIIGPDILIVLAVVLVLFGGTQLPKLARSLGSASHEFRKGIEEGAGDSAKGKDAKGKESKGDKSAAGGQAPAGPNGSTPVATESPAESAGPA